MGTEVLAVEEVNGCTVAVLAGVAAEGAMPDLLPDFLRNGDCRGCTLDIKGDVMFLWPARAFLLM